MYEYKKWNEDFAEEIKSEGYSDYKLCYADRDEDIRDIDDDDVEYYAYKLYFTPISLKDQWGDDWDDAPYEYNAETPYDGDFVEGKDGKNVWKEHTILVVKFYVRYNDWLELPADHSYKSPYSVSDINSGAVAWLYYPAEGKSCNGFSVHAGMTPIEVAWKIGHIVIFDTSF